jgi:glycosyl transferase, family 25
LKTAETLLAVPTLPVLFINLERDAARRERMQAQAAALTVDLQRFEAVLWNALPAAQQNELYSESLNHNQYHQALVAGEKGCYASHLGAWQWLVASEHQAVVILEDDVQIDNDFVELIAAIAALPHNWDMIKLIGREGIGKREKSNELEPLVGRYSLVHYRRIPSLTAGYVVSREGARKLLASRKPFGRPIDVDLRYWWENDLRVLGVQPAAIALDETSQQSSIGNKTPDRRRIWRKFELKLRYSLGNFWFGMRRGR